MSASIRRGTVVAFDSAAWKALVMLDGGLAEVELAVGEWVAGSLLAADDQVAVLLFEDTNPEDGVVLGPFGAASSLLAVAGIPSHGQVPIGNGSGLTLATLTGTANRVTVTNGAGTITLSTPTVPAVRLYHSANQSVPNNANASLRFNSEDYDTDGLHPTSGGTTLTGTIATTSGSPTVTGTGTLFTTELKVGDSIDLVGAGGVMFVTAIASDTSLTVSGNATATTSGTALTRTNNPRVTIVTAGKYRLGASVEWAANAAGRRRLSLLLNGVTVIASNDAAPSAANPTNQGVATTYLLQAGDVLEVVAFQNSGGSLAVNRAANYSAVFTLERID